MTALMLTNAVCQQARLARDSRFDGLFFTAVKSTGIFCRPICPARAPAEQQVSYYFSAAAASLAGFRPCLRCRPDSAPGSAAWQGTQTTLHRALRLIDEGALQQHSQLQLASRLGITDRYLRKLFRQQMGLTPTQYALSQQVLFAKKLLHETQLPVTSIAYQAGFRSVRRFNDAFVRQLQLNPSAIRRHTVKTSGTGLQLELNYRPPLAWDQMLAFWQARTLNGIDWVEGERYGRTFSYLQQPGWFEIAPKTSHSLALTLHWPGSHGLRALIQQLRRLLDLDANLLQIEQQLAVNPLFSNRLISGLRIPGLWNNWEAGVRAILGQQVSVAGARTQLNRLVQALGTEIGGDKKLFPSPQAVLGSELQMIKVPALRRQTLRDLAAFVLAEPDASPERWLSIKGIGPWTVNYARMRGQSDSDIWLAGDLGIQKALARNQYTAADNASLAPWRSYATFQLWCQTGE
ncbi:DNA-3-methyladenine glycosylase 2 family protein [Arsukibacterium sp.]|uniref:DNA-3-methyladenine glycosylase 2 family protein n=1 Tax=Arsukibacterium sp. TaxID=1977258 RepID=UPI00299D08DA|nr:AlkA N-terminal domain-containing protein [Arsukibacterium sp.]MDX1539523.1 AlkA N-terminal domain-containing protein [Arsukibacterium sp.]